MKKVLVMMSGGVDSSVAAALLCEQGFAVTGVTLRLADSPPDSGRVGGCCGLQDVEDARCVAHFLGIPHYSLNEKELFQETVLRNFEEEYHSGRTPNPCYRCNQWIKFDFVDKWAQSLGFDWIATGHYARIERGQDYRFLLRGIDFHKDQTYFLASIPPACLDHLLFPLGELTKTEVRKRAELLGLITADKEESQELCFAHDLNYRNALDQGRPGEMVDILGQPVGQHEGITGYTVGQRKGIGLSGGPFYVVRLEPAENRVVIGHEEDLLSDWVEVSEVNAFRPLQLRETLTAHPRYRHPGQAATIEVIGEERMQLRFHTPERAVTPGQVLALYEGARLVAGSIIQKAWKTSGDDNVRNGARGGT